MTHRSLADLDLATVTLGFPRDRLSQRKAGVGTSVPNRRSIFAPPQRSGDRKIDDAELQACRYFDRVHCS